MWKNIWPILILAAAAYAYYTGWDPLSGVARPTKSAGTQAGGSAVVREVQQAPQMMHDFGGGSGGAGPAQAARGVAQRAVGGN